MKKEFEKEVKKLGIDKKHVSIVIPNWNGKEFLKECLESIKKNTKYSNYKTVIIDNGSTDGSQEFIEKNYPPIQLIKMKTNKGISESLNVAIKFSFKKNKSDYIYILNNDVKMKENWLKEAINVAEMGEKIGIVGSKQFNFKGIPVICAGWIKMFKMKYYFGSQNKEVGWVSGAGMLIKRAVFERVGMFDEDYHPIYYEETDFEKRALEKGFKIVHCPSSIFLHKGGATSEKLNITQKASFSFYRNRIRYFFKHYPKIFFIPRMTKDFFWAIKNKRVKLLIKAYGEGINSLKK